MKLAVILITTFALTGCDPDGMKMNAKLPNGWKVGNVVPQDQIYSDPPEPADSSHLNLFGLREGDRGHRIYTIPRETPIDEIVRTFEVGSHAATSYGDDAAQTVSIVANKAAKIAEIIPCRVTFADAAGLKLRFLRQITEEELKKIEKLFPEDEMMQAGLERYVSEWDGKGSILAPVLKENLFHFWWD